MAANRLHARATPQDTPPSAAAPAPRCAVCGRAVEEEEQVIDIHGVTVHVGCAAYRRRRARG
jgi:hypothetical protein